MSAIVLVLVLVGPAFGQMATQNSIRVVMDNNYPPYVFQDAEGNLQGLLVDEWRLWERQTGIGVELHGLDWNEALRRMRAGEFDVIDTIFKTRERTTDLEFSKPYARIEVPVFFQKDVSGIAGLRSLKGFPVAAKAGDAAVDLLKRNGIDTVVLFTNYEAIIEAAKGHKVNVFVADEPPALYFVNKLGLQDEFRQSYPLSVGQFRRAVQKGNTALLHRVEAGFAALNPAEVKQVEEKWYGKAVGGYTKLKYLGYAAVGGLAVILGLVVWSLALNRQVNRRTADLRRTNRTLRMITECNQVLVRATDETELLQAVCRLLVEGGGYRMAWVGLAEQDEGKSVRPVAQAGFEAGYVETANITWADTERGRGPTGTAIRTGQPVIARNLLSDPVFAPWRQAALERGFVGSATLPLKGDEGVLGALMVYAGEPDRFDAGEVELLTRLAADVAYGVTALRTRAERKRAEAAKQAAQQRLANIVEFLPDATFVIDRDNRIIAWNRACETMTGVKKEALLGRGDYAYAEPFFGERRPILIDLLNQTSPELQAVYKYVRRAGDVIFAESFIPRLRGGRGAHLWGAAAPLFDQEGSRCGAIEVIRDVTEGKRVEEELRLLSAHLLEVQDQERRRLARELHDTTAQHLAALTLVLSNLKGLLTQSSKPAQALCSDCIQLANQAAQEIRTHAYLLHPPLLEAMGLAGAVEDYAEGFSARCGIAVAVEAPGDFGRLPEEMELALFRVVQESLANVLRHSGSARARIRFTRQTKLVTLEIEDMGRGIPTDKLARIQAMSGGSGVGLGGMQQRLRHLGGRLDIESSPSGTTVRATVALGGPALAFTAPD